jgi:hypothetical protein
MRFVSFLAGVASLLLMLDSCTTFTSCSESARTLSDVWYSSDDHSTDFRSALILADYHGATIAPAEIETAEPSAYMPVLLRFSDHGCMSSHRMSTAIHGATFFVISGRGHYSEGGRFFVLECICDVKKIEGSPDLARKMSVVH